MFEHCSSDDSSKKHCDVVCMLKLLHCTKVKWRLLQVHVLVQSTNYCHSRERLAPFGNILDSLLEMASVWSLTRKKRKQVHCKICHCVFMSTTWPTLWQHLQESHPIEYIEAKPTSNHGEYMKAKAQPTIAEALHVCQPFSHTSQRWRSLTDSICYFVAKDMQPFQTVNDPGFRQLLKALEPRYECPDHKPF